MTQPDLWTPPPTPTRRRRSRRPSRAEHLAAFFRSRPFEWIDARELLPVAGFAGWRGRISDLRQSGMTIENRQFRRETVVVTQYMYRPDGESGRAA